MGRVIQDISNLPVEELVPLKMTNIPAPLTSPSPAS